ncbi:hypothetical protein DFH06DRAFT_1121988 [Mycena polygramma]|nr:hypothetical protein DFH06DRAFT_1121988 [Mycena polygramma]
MPSRQPIAGKPSPPGTPWAGLGGLQLAETTIFETAPKLTHVIVNDFNAVPPRLPWSQVLEITYYSSNPTLIADGVMGDSRRAAQTKVPLCGDLNYVRPRWPPTNLDNVRRHIGGRQVWLALATGQGKKESAQLVEKRLLTGNEELGTQMDVFDSYPSVA